MTAGVKPPDLIITYGFMLRARLVQPDLRIVDDLHLDGLEFFDESSPFRCHLEGFDAARFHLLEDPGSLLFKV